MTIFASDNVTAACPEVIQAINNANNGNVDSYGDDQWTNNLERKFSELFEKKVKVFTAITGTAANSLALSAITPNYGNIYCHKISHINVDECGAPEFFTGGAKLITIDGFNGKFSAEDLRKNIRGEGVVHNTQPSTVSITQSCETGVVYKIDEIEKITEIAKKNNMKVHMDGARFSNAVVSLKKTPAEITWKSGIDVLTFGGTKNGCLDAEAIIFFNSEDINIQRIIRVGGMVKKNSIVVNQEEVRFIITDFKNEISVSYKGVVPNLFSEEKGVIAEGSLKDKKFFIAKKILAKHDENYMPPELKNLIKE